MRSWILFISLILTLQSVAQDIVFSESLNLGDLERDIEIVGAQGDNILITAQSSGFDQKIFILAYSSKDMKIEKQSELFLDFKKPVLEKIYVRKDTVYAFYTSYVDNKLSLVVSSYLDDFSKPLFTKVIAALSKRKFVSDDVALMFEHSNDWSHMVVLKTKVVNGINIISEYFVLKDFTVLVNSGLTQSNFNLQPAHFLVNNRGAFFLIYSELLTGFLNTHDLHNSFFVEHYEVDALRPKEVSISYDKKKISSNYFKIDDLNHMLVAAGFYTGKKNRFADGYFIYRYNYLREEQDVLKFSSFSDGKSQKLNRIVNSIWDNKVPNNFKVDDLILRRDGGLVLSGESIRVSENISSRSTDLIGAPSERYTFYNREILVLNISPEGKIDWAEMIVKEQISHENEQDQTSYFMMNATEALRFIYNEKINRDANMRISSISYEGEKASKNLFNNRTKELISFPLQAHQTGKDEVIIPAFGSSGTFLRSRSSLTLIKLSF